MYRQQIINVSYWKNKSCIFRIIERKLVLFGFSVLRSCSVASFKRSEPYPRGSTRRYTGFGCPNYMPPKNPKWHLVQKEHKMDSCHYKLCTIYHTSLGGGGGQSLPVPPLVPLTTTPTNKFWLAPTGKVPFLELLEISLANLIFISFPLS